MDIGSKGMETLTLFVDLLWDQTYCDIIDQTTFTGLLIVGCRRSFTNRYLPWVLGAPLGAISSIDTAYSSNAGNTFGMYRWPSPLLWGTADHHDVDGHYIPTMGIHGQKSMKVLFLMSGRYWQRSCSWWSQGLLAKRLKHLKQPFLQCETDVNQKKRPEAAWKSPYRIPEVGNHRTLEVQCVFFCDLLCGAINLSHIILTSWYSTVLNCKGGLFATCRIFLEIQT